MALLVVERQQTVTIRVEHLKVLYHHLYDNDDDDDDKEGKDCRPVVRAPRFQEGRMSLDEFQAEVTLAGRRSEGLLQDRKRIVLHLRNCKLDDFLNRGLVEQSEGFEIALHHMVVDRFRHCREAIAGQHQLAKLRGIATIEFVSEKCARTRTFDNLRKVSSLKSSKALLASERLMRDGAASDKPSKELREEISLKSKRIVSTSGQFSEIMVQMQSIKPVASDIQHKFSSAMQQTPRSLKSARRLRSLELARDRSRSTTSPSSC